MNLRRLVISLVYVACAGYIMRHPQDIELRAKQLLEQGRRQWDDAQTFRRQRNRVWFEAFVATREAASGTD